MAGLVTGSRFPTCEQRACGDPMNAISEDLVRLPETAYRAGPWIDFDPQAFDPWRIMAVRHHLSGHPLLQLDELLALGGRLAARGSIRSHRSEEHTSELQSLMRISYAVFCLKKKKH